jgi:hypothetical protein
LRAPPAEAFISYKSDDRDRVLAIVDLLAARGVRVWIDRNRIEGGGDYTDAIPRAIRDSKAVVFFATARSLKSDPCRIELALTCERYKKEHLLPVFLENVEVPDSFAWFLHTRQYIKIESGDPRLWADAICRTLKQWGIHVNDDEDGAMGPDASSPSADLLLGRAMSLGELTPYLVNRREQEIEMREALIEHSQRSPRRPIAIVAQGTAADAVEEFIERVQRYSLPRWLKYVNYDDYVQWMNFQWGGKDWQNDPRRTIGALKADIEETLGLHPGSFPAGLPSCTSDRVLVPCYRLARKEWSEAHIATIRAWLQEWTACPELAPGQPIVLLLVVTSQPDRPTLMKRFFARGQRDGLSDLAESIQDFPVKVMTRLSDITLADIRLWIRNDVKPPDPTRMIRELEEALNDPDLVNGGGVPMGRILNRLEDAYERTAREHARR